MTTEEKALALLNEVQGSTFTSLTRDSSAIEALCRAIEQHEAFKQEVSDALHVWYDGTYPPVLDRFIIPAPKPDPLVDVLKALPVGRVSLETYSRNVRAALDAAGFEIREKNDE